MFLSLHHQSRARGGRTGQAAEGLKQLASHAERIGGQVHGHRCAGSKIANKRRQGAAGGIQAHDVTIAQPCKGATAGGLGRDMDGGRDFA